MRKLSLFVVVAFIIATPAFYVAPVRAAGRTWTVVAGGVSRDGAVFANAYFPRTIEIAVGDTIRWRFEEFHNVTFLSGTPYPPIEVEQGGKSYFNPLVFYPVGGRTYDGTGLHNSGTPITVPPPKLAYSLTFTKAGTFQYVCTIHGPAMGGTVTVKPGMPRSSPSAVLAQARRDQARVLSAGERVWSTKAGLPQGNTVLVPMVGDIKGRYSLYGYTRRPLTIKRGTTVTWVMRDPFEIHTVSFQQGGRAPKPGSEVVFEKQNQGPPKVTWNPQVVQRTESKTYDGMSYANSGILFTKGFGPPNAPDSFSLTFTKPGRYTYFCWIHTFEKMQGVIVVR